MSNIITLHQLFFQPVQSLIKINETYVKALNRLGIFNVRDLIFYKPISCNKINLSPDLRRLRHGDLIQAEVILDDVLQPSSRRTPLKILASNDTGSILLAFFNKIHPYIYSRLRVGSKITISGKVELYDGMVQISHPEFIFKKEYSTANMPVYPLTYGIVGKQLYGCIIDAINLLHKSMIINNYYGHKEYLEQLLVDVKALHYVTSEERRKPHDVIARVAIRRHCEPSQKPWQSQEISTCMPDEIATASSKPRNDVVGHALSRNDVLISLAYRELFANQAMMARIRSQEHRARGRSFQVDDQKGRTILTKLGFELTNGQREAIEQIEQDQVSPYQMMRLLQGDVGSGKTIIALLTMLNVARSGAQSALMAPTDLLSGQHYQFFCKTLEGTGVRVELLTGKTSAKQKRQINADLLEGKIDILIGTHALFQERVEFKDLGYVVIDEQHRFGVEQRLELINKASHPDVLVMTATPIPRSLALTMLGDMDVSQIKSKPQNRLPIITTIISSSKREEVVASLERKLQAGEKVYWICPLVDEKEGGGEASPSAVIASEAIPRHCEPPAMAWQSQEVSACIPDEIATSVQKSAPPRNDGVSQYAPRNDDSLSNVTTRFADLSAAYPDQVLLVHGKLKGGLKDQVMQEFKEGSKNILVATTVIEVGIDVPEATLIIIENAEQFGLAQLHQLRGRVGRGSKQSHCVLMYEPKRFSKDARERLSIMRRSNDGFYIAEQDLLLRGGGEILGVKQSGEPEFFFADLARDGRMLLEVHDKIRHCEEPLPHAVIASDHLGARQSQEACDVMPHDVIASEAKQSQEGYDIMPHDVIARSEATRQSQEGYDETFTDFQIELFRRGKK